MSNVVICRCCSGCRCSGMQQECCLVREGCSCWLAVVSACSELGSWLQLEHIILPSPPAASTPPAANRKLHGPSPTTRRRAPMPTATRSKATRAS